jgi:superfamily I DNA/RNA helicase
MTSFKPTLEQLAVIQESGSAFVSACPGAGKTKTLVERARRLFDNPSPGRGVAFLSFTKAAIFELETRLKKEQIMRSPWFPNFIGTFDRFIWQFLVAPYGLCESSTRPKLIPDMPEFEVNSYGRKLSLSCFCPHTGDIISREASRSGFNISDVEEYKVKNFISSARLLRSSLRDKGYLGFEEARALALDRIQKELLSNRLSEALFCRFSEIIVDETQDCNLYDLGIISWLRETGIPLKIVCDPQQSIYGFRGGVNNDLNEFESTFSLEKRLRLKNNFRSSPNICKTIAQLRSFKMRDESDNAIGTHKNNTNPVIILSYSGKVSSFISTAYCQLLFDYGINISDSPIVASTISSAAAALGITHEKRLRYPIIQLAEAVMQFHFADDYNQFCAAIESVHRIILVIEGKLNNCSYNQYLVDNEIEPGEWRSKVVSIIRRLRFDPNIHVQEKDWHKAAQSVLEVELTIEQGKSIGQKLPWNSKINSVLTELPKGTPKPRTIHSVKGMEFSAICVVTTSKNLKSILDYLINGEPVDMAENARKLYVAASRAKELLVIAAPKNQAKRLQAHLAGQGAVVTLKEIGQPE